MRTDLAGFSDDALAAELQRRKNETARTTNKDYYYFITQLDPDDEETKLFAIVHRRYWHEHHSLSAGEKLESARLPNGFFEATSSTFEYDGSLEDGARALEAAGFTKLENPLWHTECSVRGPINSGKIMVTICCDTLEISSKLFARVATMKSKLQRMRNVNELKRWIHAILPNAVTVVVTSAYSGGCEITVIANDVAKSLPPYPTKTTRV